MSKIVTALGFVVGLIYGGWAVIMVYTESPLALQMFIAGGVAVIGASAGWLLALVMRPWMPRLRGVRQ